MGLVDGIVRHLSFDNDPQSARGAEWRDAASAAETPNELEDIQAPLDVADCQSQIDIELDALQSINDAIENNFQSYRDRDNQLQTRRNETLCRLHKHQGDWKAETERLMHNFNDIPSPLASDQQE